MLPALLAVALLAGPPVTAPAETEAKAKTLSDDAKELFAQRRYFDAIAKFRESNSVMPSSANVYNIGKCFERLGETALALRNYREYRRIEAKADDDRALQKDIVDAEAKLRGRGVQQLVVYADPPIAEISVDGRLVAASPAYVELSAGEHQLAVTASGYEPVKATIAMEIARIGETRVRLRPVGEGPSRASDAPKQMVLITMRDPKDFGLVGQKEEVSWPKRHVFTLVSAGVAVAAGGTALGLGVAHLNANAQLHVRDSNRTTEQATQLYNRASDLETGRNVAIGVAAAATVAAIVLFFVEGR